MIDLKEMLERERKHVIRAVMTQVENYVERGTEEHESIRRVLMNSTELQNWRIAEKLEQASASPR